MRVRSVSSWPSSHTDLAENLTTQVKSTETIDKTIVYIPCSFRSSQEHQKAFDNCKPAIILSSLVCGFTILLSDISQSVLFESNHSDDSITSHWKLVSCKAAIGWVVDSAFPLAGHSWSTTIGCDVKDPPARGGPYTGEFFSAAWKCFFY